ncbi:hypothetical protein [Leeuwenhoekiella marinoflava]|uniref:Uncharacterized protein n=2 Tax=Leeuwenhoekiella marinoflava TaxID=988 RepID=A0A4Q0PR34_9FLAO|nr:hypothetical protein [Leeuwenhoekiella marinoflava]RXG33017.1 hypothetical protein DSL99_110 [Leeuwenhoekiella marinoflava]SHE35581.1 hypothetical protein SAMN02745246_00169 [Leeuwenhoekiella marinoflava DSM 3653]
MNVKLYTKYVVALAFAIGFVGMGYSKGAPPPPIPPPVGAQVPIDDYIPSLFFIAFIAGIYFYSRLDKKQATNA